MLKGCQKRVIWVRNPESKWFDEAYFILSDSEGSSKKTSENDMLREANKIIAASPFAGYYGFSNNKTKKRNALSILGRIKWFTVGAITCALVASAIFLLL